VSLDGAGGWAPGLAYGLPGLPGPTPSRVPRPGMVRLPAPPAGPAIAADHRPTWGVAHAAHLADHLLGVCLIGCCCALRLLRHRPVEALAAGQLRGEPRRRRRGRRVLPRSVQRGGPAG